MPHGNVVGLRTEASAHDVCDSTRTGLDHVSVAVAKRDALDDAVVALDERGITHGEDTHLEGFGIAILSFSDPDGVHLELTAPL